MKKKWIIFLLFLEFLVPSLQAQDSKQTKRDVSSDNLPSSIPAGFENKKRMSENDLSKKKELGYFTGLPLVNSDPDTGIGYGVRGYYYYNGERKNPYFSYTPYFYQTFVQFFATTNGFQSHGVEFDAPYLLGSPYRLSTSFFYDKNISENYFGVDSDSLKKLELPLALQSSGQTFTFDSLKEYNEKLNEIQSDGSTYAKYNKYLLETPTFNVKINRDFGGGIFKLLGGIKVVNASIRDYSGEEVENLNAESGAMGKSKLREDYEAGRLIGYEGGVENIVTLGVAHDTRDFEPDPKSGTFSDLIIDYSTKALGSDYDYARYTLTSRIYYSPIPKQTNLVLAARGLYSIEMGDVPFYSKESLGGVKSLRGYRSKRFVGDIRALMNFEARWNFTSTENFSYLLVPFYDRGRVFDEVEDTEFGNWKESYGMGLRIAWNLATVIIVDFGLSEEDSGLYVNFNHIF